MAVEMPDPRIPLSVRPPEFASPFQMAGQTLTLANAIESRNDEQVIRDYLASGKNISTPQGLQQAMTDLQGKVSGRMSMQLANAAQTAEIRRLDTVAKLAQIGDTQLDAQMKQFGFMDNEMTNALDVYDAAAAQKGSQAAVQDFEQRKNESIARAQSMVNPVTGQPVFSPQALEQYRNMSPAQVRSLRTSVLHQREMLKEAADLRLKNAQAQQAEARAKFYGETGGAGGKNWVPTFVGDEKYVYNKNSGDVLRENPETGDMEEVSRENVPQEVRDRISGIKAPRAAVAFTPSQLTAFVSARVDVPSIRANLFKDGKLDESVVWAMQALKVPGGKLAARTLGISEDLQARADLVNRELASLIALRSQVEYGLRGGGTEMTQKQEWERYGITVGDTTTTATRVLDRLDRWLRVGAFVGEKRRRPTETELQQMLGTEEFKFFSKTPTVGGEPATAGLAPGPTRTGTTPKAATTALKVPKGIPAGSVPIGKTPQNQTVWQSPDNKKWIE